MKRLSAFLITLLFMSTTFAISADFTVIDKPVRPSCIALFNYSVTAQPIVSALDLTRCQVAQETRVDVLRNKKGQLYYYKNGKDNKDGAYYYKYLGKTHNGIAVLHTYQSHANLALTDMLLLLKLVQVKRPVIIEQQTPVFIKATDAVLVAYIKGGHACSGGIKSAKIFQNSVVVTKYPTINSAQQCKGAQTFLINTANWSVKPLK